MTLLTKTVEVILHPSNIKHFEEKGYAIPRRKNGRVPKGSKIKVKVEDLTDGSNVKVEVKCDCEDCKNPYLKPMTWYGYKKRVHEGEKYYCQRCAVNLFVRDRDMEVKLSKSISVEKWCIDNNRLDILERWDYELNEVNPNKVCYSSNKKYYLKCPKGLHKSEKKKISDFIRRNQEGTVSCNSCNSFAQWGIDNIGDDFLEKYWDYEKNEGIDPWKLSWGCDTRVWIICQKKEYHGSYDLRVSHFTREQSRCPYCATHQGKVHPKDSLGQYIIDNFGEEFLNSIWSDKNDKSPFEYTIHSNKKVWWSCSEGKHKDYHRNPNQSYSTDFRCPKCVEEREESFLQEKVRLYLESLNYIILHEHKCSIIPKNPKTSRPMPYDNEIKGVLKLIIEVHGKQHYKLTNWYNKLAKQRGTTVEYEFHYRKLKDRYKRIYAYIKGYNYLEIPYWTDNVDNEWKQLIDDKIEEILQNTIREYITDLPPNISINKQQTNKSNEKA